MNKLKFTIKCFLFFLLISTFLLPNVALLMAKKEKDNFVKPILVGKDPKKDADPASVDIIKVYITNNGTHFRFIIKCRAKPEPSMIRSYNVWIDIKDENDPDYCLVAGGVSGLYEVKIKDGVIKLELKASIEVEVKGKSIYLTAKLSDIDYQSGKDIVGIVVTTHQPLIKIRDRAPDSGRYEISHAVVPELPWPTSMIFIPAVVAAICTIYRWRFRNDKQ